MLKCRYIIVIYYLLFDNFLGADTIVCNHANHINTCSKVADIEAATIGVGQHGTTVDIQQFNILDTLTLDVQHIVGRIGINRHIHVVHILNSNTSTNIDVIKENSVTTSNADIMEGDIYGLTSKIGQIPTTLHKIIGSSCLAEEHGGEVLRVATRGGNTHLVGVLDAFVLKHQNVPGNTNVAGIGRHMDGRRDSPLVEVGIVVVSAIHQIGTTVSIVRIVDESEFFAQGPTFGSFILEALIIWQAGYIAGVDLNILGGRSATDVIGSSNRDSVVANSGEGSGQGVSSGVDSNTVDSPCKRIGQWSVGNDGYVLVDFNRSGTFKFHNGSHVELVDGDIVNVEVIHIIGIIVDGYILCPFGQEEGNLGPFRISVLKSAQHIGESSQIVGGSGSKHAETFSSGISRIVELKLPSKAFSSS